MARFWPRFRQLVVIGLLLLAVGPLVWLLVMRVLPVPITPLMIDRWIDGHGLSKDWTATSAIARPLKLAVIASEDNKFCQHHGFDLDALEQLAKEYERRGKISRGGSTISQQTAKNLFLLPTRSFLRKGLEAYYTLAMELLWPKERILEVYLNIAEWGPGLYGAEMAAQHYFHKPASALTRSEAALLAAVLPNPRRWQPNRPTAYIYRRAAIIGRRLSAMEDYATCLTR